MNREVYKNLLDLAKFRDEGEEFYEKLIDCLGVLKTIDDFHEQGEEMFNINEPEVTPALDETKKSLSNEDATKNAKSAKYGFFETIRFVGEDK